MEDDDKFADRYRIESTRLPGYDYSSDGYYFITICVKNRECLFGDVVEEKMVLSLIGKIMGQELLKTAAIRKNVRIDTCQIMPNHLHVIFVIDNSSVETAPLGRLVKPNKHQINNQQKTTQTASNIVIPNTPFNALDETPQRCPVETPQRALDETPQRALDETPQRALDETPQRGRLYNNERGEPHPWHKSEWKSNSLGAIINQFKSVCTKRIRKIDPTFAWQSRFYDHIIRTESSLNKIRQYIKNNPPKWKHDRNNPENLWM